MKKISRLYTLGHLIYCFIVGLPGINAWILFWDGRYMGAGVLGVISVIAWVGLYFFNRSRTEIYNEIHRGQQAEWMLDVERLLHADGRRWAVQEWGRIAAKILPDQVKFEDGKVDLTPKEDE